MKLSIIFILLLLAGCEQLEIKQEKKVLSKREYYYQKINNNLIVDSVFLCASRFGLSHELIFSIILNESCFDPDAKNININGSVDRGLMQLNSYTFLHLTVNEIYDIECNIFNGTKLLAELMRKYNENELKTLMAYNGGCRRVDNGTVLPKVMDYAWRVMKSQKKYEMEWQEFQIKNSGIKG